MSSTFSLSADQALQLKQARAMATTASLVAGASAACADSLSERVRGGVRARWPHQAMGLLDG
jgi:hypothetical protein